VVIDRVVVTALKLAEHHLRAEAPVGPFLILAGPRGEAVLRVDTASESERRQLFAKADLIATALAAEACAWVCTTRLLTSGAATPVVAVAGEHVGGSVLALAGIEPGDEGPTLRRLASPLDACRSADAPSPLRGFIRSPNVSERDAAEAWRRLEAMGITLGETRRALH
jgi:hypothetical protein